MNPNPTPRPRTLLRAMASTAAVLAAVGSLGLVNATGAAAATPSAAPSGVCNPAVDKPVQDILNSKVEAVVTDFSAINVAPGTTGQRYQTLTRVDTVTTTVNRNTEISASASFLFFKVSATVGFSVQTTTSSTTTTTASNTWNFNQPGYYGLYRGTQKVSGEYVEYTCARAGAIGFWLNTTPNGKGTFTTFGYPEEGTVSCASPEAAGTLRNAARQRLAC
ncbi:hypothetical protein [Kitasatospora purpeofusca]|uniref:hypothetical protein n=1 Tax=Kitasatospora purpeofusca TaxID=67352 RepID=UPI0004C0721B|nr:hypothetical protein [Kitasatospora purpeofusca]